MFDAVHVSVTGKVELLSYCLGFFKDGGRVFSLQNFVVTFGVSSWLSGLALAFHDGSIQILHRLSLHTMGVFYGGSSSAQRPGDESAIKRQRTTGPAVHFKALQFSWTSLALAGVDNHGKVRTHMWVLTRPGLSVMLLIVIRSKVLNTKGKRLNVTVIAQ